MILREARNSPPGHCTRRPKQQWLARWAVEINADDSDAWLPARRMFAGNAAGVDMPRRPLVKPELVLSKQYEGAFLIDFTSLKVATCCLQPCD